MRADVRDLAAHRAHVGDPALGRRDRRNHRSLQPTSLDADQTPPATVKRIVGDVVSALGPVQIAAGLGIAVLTVHAVLVRCRIDRFSRIDRVTGEPIRRYEHDHSGSLIYVDITRFGDISGSGGHTFLGRLVRVASGSHDSAAMRPPSAAATDRGPSDAG